MDYAGRVATVERETDLIVAALQGSPRAARVPTCPDFDLAELTAHVGEFTALWTHILCEATSDEKTPFAQLEEAEDLAAWYEPLAGHLVERLHATAGDTACWMWLPDHQTADGVARRCANELSIHRYDLQIAASNATPLGTAAALDAIDEIFVMLPVWDNPPEGSGKTLLLDVIDGGPRSITLAPEGPRLHTERRAADLTLTGTASDLALLLFERPTIGTVRRDGDPTALEAWYREFCFD